MKKMFILSCVFGHALAAQWVHTGLDSGATLCFASNGSSLIAGTETNGVFVSTDNGANWTPINSGITKKHIFSVAISGTNLFAGTQTDGIFLSTDDGSHWIALNRGIPDDFCIDAFHLSVVGTNIFASVSEGGLCGTTVYPLGAYRFASKDSGWVSIDLGWGEFYRSSLFASFDSDILALAGGIRGSDRLYTSADTGRTWTAAASWPPTWFVNSIVVVPTTGIMKKVFVGGSGESGISVSSDKGMSWVSMSTGLPKNYQGHYDVRALVNFGADLFAATDSGIFRLTIDGAQWVSVNSGMDLGTNAYCLIVHDGDLYAGTSSGVWRRPISEMTSVMDISIDLPNSLALHQNFPNPFNPSTTIRFSVPTENHLRLTVFNLLGQKIEELVNETVSAGLKQVTWNAQVPTGVYMVQLEGKNAKGETFRETKRMVLTK